MYDSRSLCAYLGTRRESSPKVHEGNHIREGLSVCDIYGKSHGVSEEFVFLILGVYIITSVQRFT